MESGDEVEDTLCAAFGDDNPPPLTRVIAGNSEQADATAPINYQGTAQTR